MKVDAAGFAEAMERYRSLRRAGALTEARAALLDAHDIGWWSARRHVGTHLHLLLLQLRQRQLRGLRFQLLQLALAAPNSWTGQGPPPRAGGGGGHR